MRFRKIQFLIAGLVLLAGLALALANTVDLNRTFLVTRQADEDFLSKETSVLVLGQVGVGQGGRWHASPELTDAIVLVHYSPEQKRINLISLPRDLYGEFGGRSLRLNRLYPEGKIDDLMSAMSNITGVDVDKYIVLDLAIVSKFIDNLGGVDVDIPTRVTDPVSGFVLSPGVHRLSGEDAVWLIRNRFAPEGDFFREKNQHLVVKAVFDRFNNLSPLRKTAFAFLMLPELNRGQTNFEVNDLILQFRDAKDIEFNSVVLDFGTGLLVSSSVLTPTGQAAYILVPRAGTDNYEEIRAYIQKQLE